MKVYTEEQREGRRQAGRKYRAANKDKRNEATRKWRADNPEKITAYEDANRELRAEQKKVYRVENKEAIYEYQKKYKDEHRPVIQERDRNYKYKNKYGITLEEYNEMWDEQEGYCAICNEHEDETKSIRLVVDHNHETDEVRGLLCNNCNCAIGLLKDSALVLESAAAYLEHRGSYG